MGSIESDAHTCSVNISSHSSDSNGKSVGKINRGLVHQQSSQSTNTSLDDDRRDAVCLACRNKVTKQRKTRVSFSLSSDSNDSSDRPRANTNGSGGGGGGGGSGSSCIGATRKKGLKFQYGFDEERFASINAVASAAITSVTLNSTQPNASLKNIEIEELPADESDHVEHQMIPFLT